MRRITALLALMAMVVMSVPIAPASASTMLPQTPFRAGTGPKGIAIGDVDGDGCNDVAVANFRSANVHVFLQTSGGGPLHTTPDATITLPAYSNPASVKIVDFTGDGANDILVGDSWYQMVHIYQSEPGGWTRVYSIPTYDEGSAPGGPFSNPMSFDVGLANLDSRPDLLIPRYYVTDISSNSNTNQFEGDFGGLKYESGGVEEMWQRLTSISVVPGRGFIPSYAIASSPDGNVSISQDDGLHWRWRIVAPGTVRAVDFVDPSDGWAVGDDGLVRRSFNGGHDWTKYTMEKAASLNDVSVPAPGIAFAVGESGAIRRFESTWASIDNTKTPYDLNSCSFVSTTRGYAVGWGRDAAYVAMDSNGVITVNTQRLPSSGPWFGVSARSGAGAVAVGAGGAIAHSDVDTWTAQPSGTGETLRDVVLVDDEVGYAVGDNGTVLRTDDGGFTWAPLASGTGADLYGVAFLDRNEGWVVGAFGTKLHTVNGGLTWEDQSANMDGGSGGFHVFYASAQNPYVAKIADFDDDGKSDLGSLGFVSGRFSPMYLTGGNYPLETIWVGVPDVQPTVAQQGIGLEAGDLNSDYHNDIAALSYTGGASGRGVLSVALQNCISWLSNQPTQELPTGVAPQDLALGDVTGDGRPDACITNSYNSGASFRTTGTVGVYVQTAEGSLEPMREFDVGRQPYHLEVGDVDSDGHNEIVVTNEVSNTLQVLHYGLPLPPKISSTTHPSSSTYYRATRATLLMEEPPDFDGVEGFYYVVDRNPSTVPDANARYTTENQLVADFQQLAGTGSVQGDWYAHFVSRDSRGNVGDQASHFRIRIDTQPPSSPAVNTGTSAWTEGTSRDIDWTASTDPLSGLFRYWVYVDKSLVASTTETKLTLDNLKEGASRVWVAASDNAGNYTTPADHWVYIDRTPPTVAITYPAVNQLLAGKHTFTATAADAAGVKSVAFYVDDKLVYNDVAAPWAVTFGMTSFMNGAHTLKVTATDMYGHTTSQTRAFRVDNTPPVLSRVSDYPDPFYPVLRDGYKDYSTVRFTTSEAGTAYLQIYTASGVLWREVKLAKGAGAQAILWDGKGSTGKVAVGTFSYRITMRDAAGNVASTAKLPVTIRNYEVVRVAPNRVRIVPR